METNHITVTDLVRRFSDIVNRVYYQRQTFLLTRGNAVNSGIKIPKSAEIEFPTLTIERPSAQNGRTDRTAAKEAIRDSSGGTIHDARIASPWGLH